MLEARAHACQRPTRRDREDRHAREEHVASCSERSLNQRNRRQQNQRQRNQRQRFFSFRACSGISFSVQVIVGTDANDTDVLHQDERGFVVEETADDTDDHHMSHRWRRRR
eukprot:3638101-Rhodomonas_salina.1